MSISSRQPIEIAKPGCAGIWLLKPYADRCHSYGMARATLIIRERRVDVSGGILDIKVWRVPAPVPPSIHTYKYSLYYGRGGQRLVGFDNERGKGDHIHVTGQEKPYSFTSLDILLKDFFAVVRALEDHDDKP